MKRIMGLIFIFMFILSSLSFANSPTDTLTDTSIKKPTITIITYPSKQIRNNKELVDLINEKIRQKFNPIKNPSWQYKFLTYGTDTSLELEEMIEKIMTRSEKQLLVNAEDLTTFGKSDKDDVVIFVHLQLISAKASMGFFSVNRTYGLECAIRAVKTNEGNYYYYKTLDARGESEGHDHAIKDGINNIFNLVNDETIPLPTIDVQKS